MFTLTDFKKTRFYQDTFSEGKLEGKLDSIPNLIKLGLTSEQVAISLDLDLVKQFSKSSEN